MKKRALSTLLCLCMVFALLPTTALAQDYVDQVKLTVAEPAVGEMPAEIATLPESASTYVKSMEWVGKLDDSGAFQVGIGYTVVFLLGLKAGVNIPFRVTDEKLLTVNGKPAALIWASKDELRLSYEFPPLARATDSEAAAADVTTYQAARALYALGLFNGYDNTGTNFGLEDSLTREQALILLIRLLGEESTAKVWTGTAPFTDVPSDSFARPYIGYAKEKGYTSGTGGGAFGLGQRADQKNMVVFALRGLGYSDSGAAPDFTYAGCLDRAVELGVIDTNQSIADFNRGDAVDILFGALGAQVKGGTQDLLTKLQSGGVLTQEQINKAAAILEDPAEREAPAKPAEQTKPAEEPKPAEPEKPASPAATEDPLPPKDLPKSVAWVNALPQPSLKTNAYLVGDYETLEQWSYENFDYVGDPVDGRRDAMRRELNARVRALNDYVKFLARAEECREYGNEKAAQDYANMAQEMKDSDAYKRAMASDQTPLKPYLSDEAIAFYGL